ncbi:MAG TPA: GGDEF domain-containing protein [Polyangiaceae bacterium]|nr:GGDEF domain-containing protein [Polyangiaceae bacterium]
MELAKRTGPFQFDVVTGPDALPLAGVAQLIKLGTLAPAAAVVTLTEHAEPTTVVVRRGDATAAVPASLLEGDVAGIVTFALVVATTPSDLAAAATHAVAELSRQSALRAVTDRMLEAKSLADAAALLLAGITAGHGLGFHRAVLFVPEKPVGSGPPELIGWKATGPATREEAHRIWESMEEGAVTFERALAKAGAPSPLEAKASSMRLCQGSSKDDEIGLAVTGAQSHFTRTNGPVAKALAKLDPAEEFILARLGARDHLFCLCFADRRFGDSKIDPVRARALEAYLAHGSLVLETLRLLKENEELARHDALTGLLNRRELEARFGHERSRAQRAKTPLAFLLIDLDLLRETNNKKGHEAGDAALRTTGAILKEELRAHDIAARFGGDELGVVLPGAGSLEAALVARRIGEAAWHRGISLSIGASAFPDDTDHPDDLVAIADKNLYAAKASGRGRACISADGEPLVFVESAATPEPSPSDADD